MGEGISPRKECRHDRRVKANLAPGTLCARMRVSQMAAD
jgi:hypothetical protein